MKRFYDLELPIRLLSLWIILTLWCFTAPAQVLEQDSLVLVAFYNSTGGPNWNNNTDWLTGPVGTWYGITVKGDRVNQIILNSNNLIGTLPSELGQLDGLVTIACSNDDGLIGEIPVELFQIESLKQIGIGNCSLTGTIPKSIGNCSCLTELNLPQNNLTGSIPSEIGNLDSLIFLNLHDNQLTGPIPPELGNCTNLWELRLNNNLLTGNIPEEITCLDNLEILYVQHNQLTGQLPTYLSNLFYPLHFDPISINVSNNLFSGPVPDEWGELSFIISGLNISNNHFTSLPDAQFNYIIDFFTLDFNDLRFEDLEPHYLMYLNGNYGLFDYEPQSNMLEEIDTTLIPGNNYSIYAGTGGENTIYRWYKNASLIEGENNDTLYFKGITEVDEGTYFCSASNSLVSGLELWRRPVHITIDTSGVHINNLMACQSNIEIYPNPANEFVNIKIPDKSKTVIVTIFDVDDKTVLIKEILETTQQNATLNISDLCPGVYLLDIISNKKHYTTKFIKNKRGTNR
jgi:Leucine-rich repeat (LRR) protein